MKVAAARCDLGSALLGANKLDEAERELLVAWGKLEGAEGELAMKLRSSIAEKLKVLYTQMGRAGDAAKYGTVGEGAGTP